MINDDIVVKLRPVRNISGGPDERHHAIVEIGAPNGSSSTLAERGPQETQRAEQPAAVLPCINRATSFDNLRHFEEIARAGGRIRKHLLRRRTVGYFVVTH